MEEVVEQVGEVEPQEAPSSETSKPVVPEAIPYDRFKAVVDQRNEMEKRLKELEKAEQKRSEELQKERQAKMKEQEQFKQLAEEWEAKAKELEPKLEQTSSELEKSLAALESFAKAQMEMVPEPFRAIVEKLPVTERLEWLAENVDKLKTTEKRGIPSSPNPRTQPEMTAEERRRRAAKTF